MRNSLKNVLVVFIVGAFFAQFILFALNPPKPDLQSRLNFDHKLAVLFVFNGKHDQEAENLFASIKKNAPQLIPYVTICVSDLRSKQFARRHNLQYFTMPTITATGKYMTPAMRKMNRRKLEAIEFLLSQGKDVLYTDTDVVFLADPLRDISRIYDLSMQVDDCSAPYNNPLLCSGFMFINSNPRTVDFFHAAVEEMYQKSTAKDFGDQEAINLLLQNGTDLSVHALDPCKFPNGCRYFEMSDKNCKRGDALIIHNNFIIGLKRKHKRFKEHNLLFYKHG